MPKRFIRLVPAYLIAVLPWAAGAEEGCIKQVFNEYCLGGEMEEVLRRAERPIHQQRDGERFAVIYPEGDGSTYVMAFRGQVYKVLRRYEPSTILRMEDLETVLSSKYGAPEDHSRYPSYARNRASRIGAIRRGEGRAELVWEPNGAPWTVTLAWNRELGLNVYYTATELDQRQEQAAEGGF